MLYIFINIVVLTKFKLNSIPFNHVIYFIVRKKLSNTYLNSRYIQMLFF